MGYSLRLPDGSTVDDIPDSVPRDRAYETLRESYPDAFAVRKPGGWNTAPLGLPSAKSEAVAPPPKRGGIMGSLSSGTESLLSASRTGVEAVLGDAGKAAEAGLARDAAFSQKYTQEVGLQKVKDKYESEGITAAAQEVLRQFPHVLASQAPQIALTIAGAKGGAIAGGAVAGIPGAAVGAVLGGAGSLLPQYIGANVERQAQAQKEAGQAVAPNVGTAALSGAGQAALDYASLRLLGGNMVAKWMGLPAKTAEQEAVKAAQRSLSGAAGVGAAKGTVEMPTEVAQQVLERWQAGMPLFDDEAKAEYGEALYQAGMVGPTIGGVAGVSDRSAARTKVEADKRAKAIADNAEAKRKEQEYKQSPEYLNSVEGLTAQRSALGEKLKGLKQQIKKAEGEEKEQLKAQHAGLVGQVKELSDRIATAKMSPEERFVRQVTTPTAEPQRKTQEVVDDAWVQERRKELKSKGYTPKQIEAWLAQAKGEREAQEVESALDPATESLLLSITDPQKYADVQKLWAKAAQEEREAGQLPGMGLPGSLPQRVEDMAPVLGPNGTVVGYRQIDPRERFAQPEFELGQQMPATQQQQEMELGEPLPLRGAPEPLVQEPRSNSLYAHTALMAPATKQDLQDWRIAVPGQDVSPRPKERIPADREAAPSFEGQGELDVTHPDSALVDQLMQKALEQPKNKLNVIDASTAPLQLSAFQRKEFIKALQARQENIWQGIRERLEQLRDVRGSMSTSGKTLVDVESARKKILDDLERLRSQYTRMVLRETAENRAVNGKRPMSRREALRLAEVDAALRQAIEPYTKGGPPSFYPFVRLQGTLERLEKARAKVIRQLETVDTNNAKAVKGIRKALFNIAKRKESVQAKLAELRGKELERRPRTDIDTALKETRVLIDAIKSEMDTPQRGERKRVPGKFQLGQKYEQDVEAPREDETTFDQAALEAEVTGVQPTLFGKALPSRGLGAATPGKFRSVAAMLGGKLRKQKQSLQDAITTLKSFVDQAEAQKEQRIEAIRKHRLVGDSLRNDPEIDALFETSTASEEKKARARRIAEGTAEAPTKELNADDAAIAQRQLIALQSKLDFLRREIDRAPVDKKKEALRDAIAAVKELAVTSGMTTLQVKQRNNVINKQRRRLRAELKNLTEVVERYDDAVADELEALENKSSLTLAKNKLAVETKKAQTALRFERLQILRSYPFNERKNAAQTDERIREIDAALGARSNALLSFDLQAEQAQRKAAQAKNMQAALQEQIEKTKDIENKLEALAVEEANLFVLMSASAELNVKQRKELDSAVSALQKEAKQQGVDIRKVLGVINKAQQQVQQAQRRFDLSTDLPRTVHSAPVYGPPKISAANQVEVYEGDIPTHDKWKKRSEGTTRRPPPPAPVLNWKQPQQQQETEAPEQKGTFGQIPAEIATELKKDKASGTTVNALVNQINALEEVVRQREEMAVQYGRERSPKAIQARKELRDATVRLNTLKKQAAPLIKERDDILRMAREGEPKWRRDKPNENDRYNDAVSKRARDLSELEAKNKEGGESAWRSGAEKGITVEEASALAAKAQELLPAMQWYPTVASVPDDLRAKIELDNGKLENLKGGLLRDGTPFIIAENHANAADLEATIQHEIVGHYKMDRIMFGNRTGLELMRDLADQYLSGPPRAAYKLMNELGFTPEVQALVVKDSLGKENPDLHVLREIVARAAEIKPTSAGKRTLRFLKELWGAFKNRMRDLGFNWKLSDADVFFMVKRAQEGKPRVMEGGETAWRTKTATPAEIQELAKLTHPDKPGWRQAFSRNAFGTAFRTQWVDRFDPIRKISERMADSMRGMNMLYFARMADRVNQFVAEAMSNGPLKLEKLDFADGTHAWMYRSQQGANVQQILDTLKDEDFRSWASYMALERAEQMEGGYEKLFADRADKMGPEQRAKMLEYGRNNAAFQEARRQYREYNAGLVDFAVQSGFLSKRAADEMKSRDYIPYYRVDDMGEIVMSGEHPIKIGNIRDQKELAYLFGSNKDIDDPFANIARNTRLLVGGALRNQAAKNTAIELQKLGLGRIVNARTEGQEAFGRNVIHFKMDGAAKSFWMDTSQDPQFADIPADLFVKGMEGVVTTMPAALQIAAIPTRILRDFITRNPLYVARQLVRDPLHAWMSTGADMREVGSAIGRVKNLYFGKDATGNMLRERGLIGGQVFQGTDEDMAKIMAEVQSGQGGLAKLASGADRLSMAADASTRAALYDNFVNQHGMNDLQAFMATMDSVNFATRGASPSIQMANMLIPFFNAQIQGLDSVYRAITGQMPFNDKLKAQQKLAQRAAMMVGSTMLYYALVQDEEWYKNTPEAVRMANWLFKLPGVDEPVRVPIPFEFGLLFKALPESMMIQSNGDAQAEAVWEAIKNQAINSIPGGSSFGLPAAGKPLVETAANHSFFTGREIVPGYLKDAAPEEQYTMNTTETAKLAGQALGISPIKIEHLVRGYTAGIGFAAMQMLDTVLSGTSAPMPEKKMSQTTLVGPLFQPVDGTAILSRAFEAVKKIEAAKGKLNAAVTESNVEEQQRVLSEKAKELGMSAVAGRFRQQIGEISKQQRMIKFAPPPWTAEQKRAEIDRLQQLKLQLAAQFETLAQ